MEKLKKVIESSIKRDPASLKEAISKELAKRGNKAIDKQLEKELKK